MTQVVAAEEGAIFHNRLIHSLKVAQVARRIAERIVRSQPNLLDAVGGVDPDVVEAAALAHDLGHPPFGHIAEKELDDLTKGPMLNGFEGNAQTFRIVTKLSVRTFEYDGLNLTRATLNAILKYPWHRGGEPAKQAKWSAYASEGDDLTFARADPRFARFERQSAEAAIMEWADDIAYGLHDVEDFYRAGWIPLHRLRSEDTEKKRFFEHVYTKVTVNSKEKIALEKSLNDMLALAPAEPYTGTLAQRATIRAFVSRYIGMYANAIQLQVPTADGGAFVTIDSALKHQVDALRELTKYYVINNPSLATQQRGQIQVIKALYQVLAEAAGLDGGTKNLAVFPESFRERLTDTVTDEEKRRFVVDLIAGMTEKQTVRLYHRLVGISSGSALEPMIQLLQ